MHHSISSLQPINDENSMEAFHTSPLKFNRQADRHESCLSPPTVQQKRRASSLKVRQSSPNNSHPRSNTLSNRQSSQRVPTRMDGPELQPRFNVHQASVVLVGDSKCGKSSLVLSYINKTFSKAPSSILFETYEKLVKVDQNMLVNLHIWDFPGADFFDRFRPLGYVNACCVLICFTLDDISTLYHIRERWIPEVETHSPKAEKLIIGIGSEIRFDKTKANDAPKFDYCYKFARKLGCRYFECSLADPKSYNKIFETVARQSIGIRYDDGSDQLGDRLIISKTRDGSMHANNANEEDPDFKPTRKTSFKRKGTRCLIM